MNSAVIITSGVREEMLHPEFWTARVNDQGEIILSPGQIAAYNRAIRKATGRVYDLESFGDNINGDELAEYMGETRFPGKTMYDETGKAIGSNFGETVRQNLNRGEIKSTNPVLWGMAVRETSLRSFPTQAGVFDSPENTQIDRFQETGIRACRAVLVLHRSSDRRWYFVQTEDYRGWAPAIDIAVARDKRAVLEYVNSGQFIVVTGNRAGGFGMGTVIPIDTSQTQGSGSPPHHKPGGGGRRYRDYIVRLPVTDSEGCLTFRTAVIPCTEDVSAGYLPYTRKNIVTQAFKLLGDSYDWGNKGTGQDCSSFVQAVYRTFGINLPRNSGDQARVPGRTIKFAAGDSAGQRNRLLRQLQPGAAVFMPGHVMMYLGETDGSHYLIHDFTGYGAKKGAGYAFVPVYQVTVTAAGLPSSSGTPFLELFTSAVQFEWPPVRTFLKR